MGLKEIVANKKLKIELTNLYCGITDYFLDIIEDVEQNRLSKSVGADMLKLVYDSGKNDYAKLKGSNPSLDKQFIERDKSFNSLFKDIENAIERYNVNGYLL